MKRAWTTVTAAALAMSLVAGAKAGIIAVETWESGASLEGWAIDPVVGGPGTGSLTPVAGGNPGGSMQLTEGVLGFPETDVVYLNDGASPLLGDWSTAGGWGVSSVTFDFYLDSNASSAGFNSLNFYFESGATTWFYIVNVSGQPADSWATYSVPVNVNDPAPAGWGTFGAPLAFNAAAMNVTEIGFEITYVTGSSQLYGFDNVMLTYSVPEPETYAAIGFALVAVALAFRRRLSEILAMVRVPTAV